jgi:hypothetical protein
VGIEPVKDQRQARIFGHPAAHVARAHGQGEDAGQPVVGHDLVGQVLHGHRGEGNQFAGLPEQRVAADRGDGRVPGPDRHGKVEGGDDAHGTERVPLLIHAVARALGVHGQPVELAREAHGEVADVDHLLHFAQPFGANLAHLQRDQLAQRLLVRAQEVAQVAHDFAALGCGDRAPAGKAGLCGGHGRVVGRAVGGDDAGNGRAGGRVVGDDGRSGSGQPGAGAMTDAGVVGLQMKFRQQCGG